MHFTPRPVYRREIIPWYDSNTACAVMIGFLLSVMLFALIGFFEARANPAFNPHTWVPLLLFALSATILASTVARLIQRHLQQREHE